MNINIPSPFPQPSPCPLALTTKHNIMYILCVMIYTRYDRTSASILRMLAVLLVMYFKTKHNNICFLQERIELSNVAKRFCFLNDICIHEMFSLNDL